jgi:hypothetical protein
MTGLSPRVIRVWFQNKRCKVSEINQINIFQYVKYVYFYIFMKFPSFFNTPTIEQCDGCVKALTHGKKGAGGRGARFCVKRRRVRAAHGTQRDQNTL